MNLVVISQKNGLGGYNGPSMYTLSQEEPYCLPFKIGSFLLGSFSKSIHILHFDSVMQSDGNSWKIEIERL